MEIASTHYSGMTDEQLHAESEKCDAARLEAKERGRGIMEELARRDVVKNVSVKLANNWALKPAEQEYLNSLSDAERDELTKSAAAAAADKVQKAVTMAASVGVKAKRR